MDGLSEKYEKITEQFCKEYDISLNDLHSKCLEIIKVKFGGTLFDLLSTNFQDVRNNDMFWTRLSMLNDGRVLEDYYTDIRLDGKKYLVNEKQYALALHMAMYSKIIFTLFRCSRNLRRELGTRDKVDIFDFLHFTGEEPLLGLTWDTYKALEYIDEKKSLVVAYNDIISKIQKLVNIGESQIKKLYYYLCDYGTYEKQVGFRQYDVFCLREKILKNKLSEHLENQKDKPDVSIDYFTPIQENWSEYKQLPAVQKELEDAEHYMQKIKKMKKSKSYKNYKTLDMFYDEMFDKQIRTKLLFLQTQVQCEGSDTIREEEVIQARKDELFFLVMHHLEFFKSKMEGTKSLNTKWNDVHFSLDYYREYLWRYGEAPEHGITYERLQEYEKQFVYCVDGKDDELNMFSDSSHMYKK